MSFSSSFSFARLLATLVLGCLCFCQVQQQQFQPNFAGTNLADGISQSTRAAAGMPGTFWAQQQMAPVHSRRRQWAAPTWPTQQPFHVGRSVPGADQPYTQNQQQLSSLWPGRGMSRLDPEREGIQSPVHLSPADMNRQSLATNLDRYMPLLANKHRQRPRNLTAQQQQWSSVEESPSGAWAEEELDREDSLEQGGPSPMDQLGPCVTANCRTWITITIPSELVGIPPAPATGLAQQKPDNSQIKLPFLPSTRQPMPGPPVSAKPMPPFPPSPMRPLSKSRGQPVPKQRPAPLVTSTALPPSAPTTRVYPPDFVFVTKWILPVNGLSPTPQKANGSAGTDEFAGSTTPAIKEPKTTTARAGIEGGGGSPWARRPYTIRPRPPSAAGSASSTSSTSSPAIPRERPSAKSGEGHRVYKPWTHSAGGLTKSRTGPAEPKSRPAAEVQQPRPPSPDTTIEQAAIWASTELIDAIREALTKFRATLNRNGQRTGAGHNDGSENDAEVEQRFREELEATWNNLRGTWLEQAVTEIAEQTNAQRGPMSADAFHPLAELLVRTALEDHGQQPIGGQQRKGRM